MGLLTDPTRYSYAYNDPEVEIVWALRRFDLSPDDVLLDGPIHETVNALGESELYRVSGRVEIEQIIDEHIRAAGVEVVGIDGTMWSRTVHLADDRRTFFWIILEVHDWRCLDCRLDMQHVDEYYMVHDDLWLSVVPDRIGHLCIGCLEHRLGRGLTAADFQEGRGSINGRYTDRLRDRVNRV